MIGRHLVRNGLMYTYHSCAFHVYCNNQLRQENIFSKGKTLDVLLTEHLADEVWQTQL